MNEMEKNSMIEFYEGGEGGRDFIITI